MKKNKKISQEEKELLDFKEKLNDLSEENFDGHTDFEKLTAYEKLRTSLANNFFQFEFIKCSLKTCYLSNLQ